MLRHKEMSRFFSLALAIKPLLKTTALDSRVDRYDAAAEIAATGASLSRIPGSRCRSIIVCSPTPIDVISIASSPHNANGPSAVTVATANAIPSHYIGPITTVDEQMSVW